ncbi:MAG: hypothetical protein ACPGOV_10285 [Magnetovibrionaceae bacterium]
MSDPVRDAAVEISQLMQKGDSAEACDRAELLVEAHPESRIARQVAAAAALQDEDPETGLIHLLWLLKRDPEDVERLRQVATVLLDMKRMAKAEPYLRLAMGKEPKRPDLHIDLARSLASQKKHAEAAHHYRVAMELDPDNEITPENLIFILDFIPEEDTARQQLERRRWYERFVEPNVEAKTYDPAEADPDKPVLRIGYVSGDFKLHSAARIFGPMIRDYDRERFEVYCYHTEPDEDEETERYQAAATEFRMVSQYDYGGLTNLIRRDAPDILVDLSTFTRGGRLETFARRAAPVQISAWGHCHGTGLPTMDYLFSDKNCIPAEERSLFSETIVDLPCVITFAPEDGLPDVSDAPFRRNGYITFGSFNRMEKLTAESLALWCRVLAAVPGSRLLLKAGGFETAVERDRVWQALQSAGLDPNRVTMAGSTERDIHLTAMSDCDIGLDTYPHGGGMTTCEMLWMGVPVIALRGRAVAGRVSSSVLSTLGLDDLVADHPDTYVSAAQALAADPDRLLDLRREMRSRMTTSPLLGIERYVRAVEDIYFRLWRDWAAG